MATPTKEELKAQRELKEYLKTLKKDSEVFTGLAGGFAAVGRGVSTASKVAKTVKNSKQAKNAFNQLSSKLKSFQSTAKTGKKAKSTVKEIVETKPTIPTNIPTSGTTVPDKIKSLSNAEIKAFETVKNIRELAEKQVKNASTTTSPIKEMWKKPLPTPSYTNDGFRIGGTEAKSILSKLKDNDAARTATKKAFEKSNAEIIKKGIESSSKKITDKVIGAGVVTGVLGAGAGTTYYGMQLSNKNNKQTTGPVDLKRIDKSKLRPSKVEGVSIVKGSDGKDYGIKWNNTTKTWDYYRGNNKPVVEPITPKPKIVKDSDVTPIDNNNQNKGTGTGSGNNQKTTTGGGGTKTPVKPTVTPTTSTYVGDEYYKANPDLEKAIQEDSIRQQREMYLEKIATKPLSSIVFKPTSKAVDVRNVMDEQDALRSIRADNKLPLKKKKYGGNLAMLKYMK